MEKLPDNFPTRYDNEGTGRAGRPPVIVRKPEIFVRILNALDEDLPVTIATKKAGLGRKTFYDYLKRGRKALRKKREEGEEAYLTPWDDAYISFYKEIMKREAELEQTLYERIKDEDKWQSDAWLMERMWPEDWSKDQTVRHEFTGEDGGAIEFTLQVEDGTKPDPDELKSYEEAKEEYDIAPPGEDEQEVIEADYEVIDEDE